MVYSLIASEAFERDLGQIVRYLSDELSSPQAARSFLEEVEAATDQLRVTPEMRAISRKPVLSDFGYREWYLKHYVLVYRIAGNAVLLARIFHQKQDYASKLHAV